LTSERIAEHLLLLFWAGYDTTATTGSWTLWELANSPEWQDRLAAETGRLLDGRPPVMEDLDRLIEHGFVLKEIERLRPAVLLFPRRNLEPVTFGGKTVPPGNMTFYSPYLTHRHPEVFPNPDAFDPGRWNPALGPKQAPSTALVGFGGGPRICLGKAFALLQLRVMLILLLRRFRIGVDSRHKMKTVALPIHRPKDGFLTFTKR
jgi:cytochrome P450